ncbi:FG-GAP repeat protein [Bremerella volcania]|uniref:FG-GAP repeat protein n=1 Tax=Bremerella volcania TaxID=2527984 RepID=A0A518C2V3_9BACT|nr:CRTAC1 family protein [Bremerella volcania]QDU73559.1 FG-GAP repeat protein [Bremerella volcania]
MRINLPCGMASLMLVCLLTSFTFAQDSPFVFRDVGSESGVLPTVAGIRGHAAAWGDVDNNGYPDLFVGTFHDSGSKPSMLLRNDQGKFTLDPQQVVQTSGSGSGALMADFTGDGNLDLFVANCVNRKDGVRANPSRLFRGDGGGKFTDVSEQSGTCPLGYAGRGAASLDYDGDGLLDLLTCEQYYSSNVQRGPVLYRNLGDMRFKDVSKQAGLPIGLGGLGVCAADVNGDTIPDIFLTHGQGEHRLLLGSKEGIFREAPGAREVFRWTMDNPEDVPAGVAIADINRDQLPDIVIGHHFSSPWKSPAPIRLYLNRGVTDGVPKFEEITAAAGLKPLHMKAPHVEIQDFDNDGWPDIYVSIVKFQDDRPCPIIYRNLGKPSGTPQFEVTGWNVNDFPTQEDLAVKRTGAFFDKLIADHQIIYMAPGPTADFDRDGKLDMFLPNWWIESPSLLLKNETPGGNWLQVTVQGSDQVNRMGVGTRVNVYPAGKLGQPDHLIGSREIAIGYGYCSGQEAVVHFGLGEIEKVDLEFIYPHDQGRTTGTELPVNRRVDVKMP